MAALYRQPIGYAALMSRDIPLYGAIEAGGTKFVCALGTADGSLIAESRLPTTNPAATLAAVVKFLREGSDLHGPLSGIGVASFGPLVLDRRSPHYGFLGKTPKAGWSHTDIVGAMRGAFQGAVGFDTDVNAAALAEHRWGAARDVSDLVYVTVGTGIGAGVLVNGVPLHGLVHPEIGHLFVRRHALDAEFAGVCPFHGDCLEGLASGPAIMKRSGCDLSSLSADHPQWTMQADYLAQLCATLVLTVSPRRIILGGGVMSCLALFPLIRTRMLHWLAGYVDHAELLQHSDRYLLPPGLGQRSGVLGALSLAMDASAASS
jgi:fructokinase